MYSYNLIIFYVVSLVNYSKPVIIPRLRQGEGRMEYKS